MPPYKLTYFNKPGRGEPARLLLAHVGVDYEDERIEMDQWPTLKPTMPFGQLPVLQDGDFILSQSIVILKYLANKHGYGGSTEQEVAKIDETLAAISDLSAAFGLFKRETDPERKAQQKKIALTQKAPFYLRKFEEFVSQNGGYLVNGKLTSADFFLAAFNDNARHMFDPEILNGYPGLQAHLDSILNAPGVKEYVARRPAASVFKH